MKTKNSQQHIIEKQKTLKQAEKQLKQEFFGIDNIIEKLIRQLTGWYCFPHLQKRPLVINLWGMTGTGKTSLLRRMAELIDFEKAFYAFEMNDEKDYDIVNTLNDLNDNKSGEPCLLLFDEFQHLRALDEKGSYMKNQLQKIVWKIIDEGKFNKHNYHPLNFNSLRKLDKLQKALNRGVKVINGEVVEKKMLFAQLTQLDVDDMDNFIEDDPAFIKKRRKLLNNKSNPEDYEKVIMKKKLRFVNFDFIEDLVRSLDRREVSLDSLDREFLSLNGQESLNFIQELIDKIMTPTSVDCTKAVVFICGNLDRAYPMSQHISADIDADIFYQQSLEVNISTIKSALSLFLRKEQLARLGNIHLIYPALSKQAYQQIIQQQLQEVKQSIQKEEKLELQFTAETADFLYQEGVYPTQGSRPLLSCIRQHIYSSLGDVLSFPHLKQWKNWDKIVWDCHENNFILSYYLDDKKLGKHQLQLNPDLSKIKSDQGGEKRVIVAVHEAGHCLVYRLLNGQSPILAISNSSSADSGGYMIGSPQDFNSKEKSIQRLAVLLGGFSAEKQIFGSDSITSGSSNDLFEAEILAETMSKMWGFQKFSNSRVYHESMVFNPRLKHDPEALLIEAFTIAGDILKKYEKALLKLSEALIEHDQLNQEEMEEIFQKYIPDLQPKNKESKNTKFYIRQFKAKAEALKR